jgi:hypothetical protein
VFNSPTLLALLIQDRQRTVARELASARRFRLRRALANAAYAVAGLVEAFGSFLDDDRSAEAGVEGVTA